MEIVSADALGDSAWDALCSDADGAWFWHTTQWREYTLAYRPALQSRSLAFAVIDGGRPLAAVPLMVESADGASRFSFGGDACWSPCVAAGADPPRAAAALREALDHVDVLAGDHGVESVSFRLSPLAPGLLETTPLFLAATTRAGYADVSLCSQVIDLERGWDAVRAAMSKGHRADITRGRRIFDVTVTTGAGAVAGFAAYREMHALAAGRVTRPASTFALMEAWLAGGNAALATASRDGVPAGFTYLIVHGDGAYYASAANHPEQAQQPVGHVLHAAVIEWLIALGTRRYELGIQQFGPLLHNSPSPKELGIARFKRGFGGRTAPLVVREKWYSREAFTRTMEERALAYTRAAWGGEADTIGAS